MSNKLAKIIIGGIIFIPVVIVSFVLLPIQFLGNICELMNAGLEEIN